MNATIFDNFPDIYRKLLPQSVFSKKIESEKTADCSNCIMCEKNSNFKSTEVKYFSPDTKCCTYHPAIPNYLIGALLSDKSPQFKEGQKRIRERIKNKVAILPKGVWVSEKYKYLYKASFEHGASFGKANSMMCPYLDNGNCSVWKYRNAICSTWFCKSDNGSDGLQFWESLKEYMCMAEKNLIQYILFSSGFPKEQVIEIEKKGNTLSAEMLDERPLNKEEYKKLWGKWEGKEEEYYIDCFKKVQKLSAISLKKIMGINGEILLRYVTKKHDILNKKHIPHRLKRNNSIKLLSIDEQRENCLVSLEDEPYQLPAILYNSLVFFDATKSTVTTISKIKKEMKLEISNDLLLHLYRTRLLTT